MNDLKFAFRQLLKNPGFTAVAVLTLALGIGANTAIFSVVNATLLSSLPFRDANRIVAIWTRDRSGDRSPVAPADFVDWRNQTQLFDQLAALRFWEANLSGVGDPERIPAGRVTANIFDLLGATAALGRTFLVEEDQEGQDRVIVISDGLWKRRFNADASVIGRSLVLNGVSRTVVGVMPPDFRLPLLTTANTSMDAELWVPLGMTHEYWQRRDLQQLNVMGRLKQATSASQAQAELSAMVVRSRPDDRHRQFAAAADVNALAGELAKPVRRPLLVISGAAAFVLLIACGNVANLLFGRAAIRQKEMAIRAALGATRSRIVRQLVTESGVLSGFGALGGLFLAVWGVNLLLPLIPAHWAVPTHVDLNWFVFNFALFISVAIGLICGLLPAWWVSRYEMHQPFSDAGLRATTGRSENRLREALVLSEMGLALTLLIGTALMVQSLARLSRVVAHAGVRNSDGTWGNARGRSQAGAPPRRAAGYRRCLAWCGGCRGHQPHHHRLAVRCQPDRSNHVPRCLPGIITCCTRGVLAAGETRDQSRSDGGAEMRMIRMRNSECGVWNEAVAAPRESLG